MSGLYTSLSMAARALDAQRMGLELTGQNISNVNTPGYARRTVDFESVKGESILSAGGGVAIAGIRSIRDTFLERRVQQEVPIEGKANGLAELLQIVEAGIGDSGEALDARLTEMFGSFLAPGRCPDVRRRPQRRPSDGWRVDPAFHDLSSPLGDAHRAGNLRVRVVGRADQLPSRSKSGRFTNPFGPFRGGGAACPCRNSEGRT